MREYARIRTSLWHSRRFMGLPSDDARLFYLYLHTCPHCNSLGCFVLPMGYAMADLGWSLERVEKAIQTLSEGLLIGFEEAESVIRIIGFVHQDSPTNPNHVRGILRVADPIPNCAEKVNALKELSDTEQGGKVDDVVKAIERVSKGYRNPTPTPTPPPTPKSRDADASPSLDSDATDVSSGNGTSKIAAKREVAERMQAIFAEELGDAISPGRLTDNKAKSLACRLKDDLGNDYERWRWFCQKVRASPFLMGEKTDFRATLNWLIKPTNFEKVMDGDYDPKPSDHRPERGNAVLEAYAGHFGAAGGG